MQFWVNLKSLLKVCSFLMNIRCFTGATVQGINTFSIMTHSIMDLSIGTLSICIEWCYAECNCHYADADYNMLLVVDWVSLYCVLIWYMSFFFTKPNRNCFSDFWNLGSPNTHTHTNTHTRARAHTRTHAHIHAHARTHAHTHTPLYRIILRLS
jgi:hypothetical protein